MKTFILLALIASASYFGYIKINVNKSKVKETTNKLRLEIIKQLEVKEVKK